MLPKSRILSALLVGIGVALMVGGFVAPAVINADGRLPLDLHNRTWTFTDDAAETRLLTDPNGRVLETPVTRQLHLDVQEPATEESASVQIGSTLLRENRQADADRLITASTWSYVMDRVTGAAETDADLVHTIGFPPETVPVDGYWLKLPSGAEPTTYDVFDEALREARPAVFIDETELGGRTVYHYRQEIEPTNVAELYDGILNTIEVDGERLPLFHSATRDLYVDQVTGLVVDAEVSIEDYYAPAADAPEAERETMLSFTGSRDPAQVEALLAELDGVRGPVFSTAVQWIVIGVGALIAIVGLIGAFIGGNGSRGRGGGPGRR